MKKKVLSLCIIAIFLAASFIVLDKVFVKKSEAIIQMPLSVVAGLAVIECCNKYKAGCPKEVQDLCFSDCMDQGCGTNNPFIVIQ